MPSQVNYRANIEALRLQGCTHVIVTTACGSLREEIRPGDMVIMDQFIDRTYRRETTFYNGKDGSPAGICHVQMDRPFCTRTRSVLIQAAKDLGLRCHNSGTTVTIEGPRSEQGITAGQNTDLCVGLTAGVGNWVHLKCPPPRKLAM